jgi:hypothetical protein
MNPCVAWFVVLAYIDVIHYAVLCQVQVHSSNVMYTVFSIGDFYLCGFISTTGATRSVGFPRDRTNSRGVDILGKTNNCFFC